MVVNASCVQRHHSRWWKCGEYRHVWDKCLVVFISFGTCMQTSGAQKGVGGTEVGSCIIAFTGWDNKCQNRSLVFKQLLFVLTLRVEVLSGWPKMYDR
jgi:hypothetical protein